MTLVEDWAVSLAMVAVYLAGSLSGSLALNLLTLSASLLKWSNRISKNMRMHGRAIDHIKGLDMAKELIKEHDERDDWTIGLGLIVPDHDKGKKTMM
jgi:hypothetical protein